MNSSTDKEAEWKEEKDDRPPGTLNNILFWFLQVLYWVSYTIVTLIYVPWALAIHILLAVLAIPLSPALCTRFGRKVFIYTYVITVMMPGKYLWFNVYLRTRRRGRVWDYEMGKPRAIPLDSRRRLSHEMQLEGKTAQVASTFLHKLPPEIRLQIYKEIFVGSSSHLHVMTRRIKDSRTKPADIKVRGYLCNREHVEAKFARCGCMIGAHAHHDPPHASEVELPMQYGNGRIAILQTCKQVYAEAIDLMYSAPTFCFNNLEQPPFFVLSALPDRLARIQHVQLCWKQVTMSRLSPAGSSLTRFQHRVGLCTFCNVTSWLRLIQSRMTGLRSIEVFLYLDKKMPVPQLGQSWVVDLLKLQKGPEGELRRMKVKVFCNNDDMGWDLQSDYKKAVQDFMRSLKKEMKAKELKKVQLPREDVKTEDAIPTSIRCNPDGSGAPAGFMNDAVGSTADAIAHAMGSNTHMSSQSEVIGPLRSEQLDDNDEG